MSGIISEEELQRKLENPDNLINRKDIIVERIRIRDSGRREGDKNIPEPVKELAGVLGHFDTLSNVAEALNISTSQVHQYKNGRNGQHSPNDELKDKIDERLGNARDIALDRLVDSLNVITPEKLKSIKAVNAASIAQKMASVLEKTGEKKNDIGNVIFQLYYPKIAEEQKFEVIEVEKIS